jgi:hypothetical protein
MIRIKLAAALICALAVVTVATGLRAQPATAGGAPSGRLQGVVWDSTRTAPLAGGVVQLVRPDGQSPPRATQTDSAGRFRLDSLTPGVWVVGVLHPRLDTLALDELMQPVDVQGRGTTQLAMGVPSAFTLSRQICRSEPTDSTGYLTGQLRRADGDRAGTSGVVRVEWVELSLVDGRLDRQVSAVEARASAVGRFLICGVPMNATARARAWSGDDSTGVVDVELPAAGITRLDFYIGRTSYVRQLLDSTVSDTDSSAVVVLRRGSGRVRGTINDELSQPLENAVLSVPGSGQSQRTSATGRFDLPGLATGTQLIDIRAIGFEPLRIPVNIFEGDSLERTFALTKVAKLATVEVRAARARMLGQEMIDFEQRRKVGLGRYFGPEDLNALNPLRMGVLFERVPGVRVVQDGMYGDRILMPGTGFQQYCSPDIWLDGFRISNDGTLDFIIPPYQLRAVEVYSRAGSIPAQYQTTSGCGVIVLWSGSREVPGEKKR